MNAEAERVRPILNANLGEVRDRITRACERSNRNSSEIRLVAVTKYVGPDVVRALVSLGVRDLGENRLQVAAPKLEALRDLPIRWHWIGHLQTNKVKSALESFQVFHSVDRLSLVNELVRRLDETEREPLPICLQVNVSGEESKSGVSAEEVEELGEKVLDSPRLKWEGLMTMAPFAEDPEESRSTFAGLREVRDSLADRFKISLPRLSMGMSSDFEVAIEEGATDLRIGTILYGGLLD
jgi:pyridoxal phosphate enzyme (YggS family)